MYRMCCEHCLTLDEFFAIHREKARGLNLSQETELLSKMVPTHKMGICRSIVSHSKKMNSTTVFQSITAGHYILPILLVKAF